MKQAEEVMEILEVRSGRHAAWRGGAGRTRTGDLTGCNPTDLSASTPQNGQPLQDLSSSSAAGGFPWMPPEIRRSPLDSATHGD